MLTPEIEFEVECKDNLKRRFPTLDKLLEFENSPKKDILVLSIWGRSKERDTRVWLKFDRDTSSNVLISIDGNEEDTVAVNNLVEERLSALKPWYSFLATRDFTLILLISVFALFLGMSLAIALGVVGGADRPSSPETIRSSIAAQLIAIAFIISPLIFGYVLNKMRAVVFPMGVFAIGQGVKRHSDKELVRTLIVIGFFISTASSVIVSLFFMLWTT
ncbi:MAG TPA: hypothetical protein VF648_03510 [Pyrinomonadaceae bacterium]